MSQGLGDQVDTNFTRGAPTKFGRAKMSKIRRDFWQLSTLIANVSETHQPVENLNSTWSIFSYSHITHSPVSVELTNYVPTLSVRRPCNVYWHVMAPYKLSFIIIIIINYVSSPVGWKKFGELWSTNQKVIDAHVDTPNCTFFGRL